MLLPSPTWIYIKINLPIQIINVLHATEEYIVTGPFPGWGNKGSTVCMSTFLAANCSTKNHYVSQSVCLGEAISFFAIYSKNLQATHT